MPRTSVPGGPGPAVVALLAGRPSRDGFRATLLDLAARGWFELRQPGVFIGCDAMQLAGPVMCVLSPDADLTTLLPYERRVAACLVWHARVSGEVAADAVTRDIPARELRAFRDQVRADAQARGLTRRGRVTEGGQEVLRTWRARCAEPGWGVGAEPGWGVDAAPSAAPGDVAYAAALGAAPLAPFAHRRKGAVRWLHRPHGEKREFDGQVLRQWEVDRGSAEGIAYYLALHDGVRARAFRVPSHVFEMLAPGALVHVHVDARRKELLGARPIGHRARAILPLCA